MLNNGSGVPVNEKEAERWWPLADAPAPDGPFRTVDEFLGRPHAVEPLDVAQGRQPEGQALSFVIARDPNQRVRLCPLLPQA